MTTVVQSDPFARLLAAEAKGFFFLKHALADHTNDQKLAAIVNRTHSLYDRAVEESGQTSFQPLFRFRRTDAGYELVIVRENGPTQEPEEVGHVSLVAVADAANHTTILALATTLPIPEQKLQKLSLVELKQQLELYYELVDVCTANAISRMVKSFEELQQACCTAAWTYDLSSGAERIGLRVRKSGHTWLALFVDIHL